MTPLDELGRRAGEEVRRRADAAAGSMAGPSTGRTRLRRRRRRRLVLAAALVAAAVVVTLPTLRATIDRSPGIDFADAPAPGPAAVTADPSPRSAAAGTPGFSPGSGLVLLFDDGYDGVLAMDLDAGVATRRLLEGQRAGDQPWRLMRQGDALVVGVDQIHAVAIATGESALLGEATIAVPAAEPDRVWLIDYPGRPLGEDPRPYRQVDLSGAVLLETPGLDPETSTPAIGIPDGLAYEDDEGVTLWDAASDEARRLGTQQGWVSDSAGSLLVWCEGECLTLHLTDLQGEDRQVPAPAGYSAFEAHSARLSPDGSRVAVIVGNGGPVGDEEDGALLVLDVGTGEPLPRSSEVVRSARVGWSPDGSELFFTSSSAYGATTLGRYLIAEDRMEFTRMPLPGGMYDLVVLQRGEAAAFLADELGTLEECQARGVWTSGEPGLCGFRYRDG